uniref:Uncharacterized protein n=1 Tax=Rhizophora mucronata TaxID=61149 RepID=A0A2P2P618_RHIMU
MINLDIKRKDSLEIFLWRKERNCFYVINDYFLKWLLSFHLHLLIMIHGWSLYSIMNHV